MQLNFFKYQATGNDFILIDNRLNIFPKNDTKLIKHLCDRKFGIGADGFILLEIDKLTDFRMVYYNSDGNESSMCGNGGRAIVKFAERLGIIGESTQFMAIDGLHEAKLLADQNIALKMIDVLPVENKDKTFFLNTGSPHHVKFVENVSQQNVYEQGKKIRYDVYGPEGSNVNFVEVASDQNIKIRTYERGVENETLSCGTGATACAIALYASQQTTQKTINVNVLGGELQVSFEPDGLSFKNVFLIGPAQEVFSGSMMI